MGYSVYRVKKNTRNGSNVGDVGVNAISFLYDREGNRKYLTRSERNAFLAAAVHLPAHVRTFCLTLAYTGARISEVLAITPRRIDASAQLIIIESLKKRRRGIYRAVPVPRGLIEELERIHAVSVARRDPECARRPLWRFCRTTAWKLVKTCLKQAAIDGSPANPKGLRHAFGVETLQAGVPINLVKRWLGHARLETTEIYTDAIGEEERSIANRFWKTFEIGG